MEMGYDAILLNSAISLATDPVLMAYSFSLAVDAGRIASQAGMIEKKEFASPSTPVLGTPFWHDHV
jgi:thiazole synthase